jgi:hypothetical protein
MGYGSGSGPLAARLVQVIYGGAIATAMSRLGSSGFVAAAGSAGTIRQIVCINGALPSNVHGRQLIIRGPDRASAFA